VQNARYSKLQCDQQNNQVASLPWAHLRLPPFPQVALRVLQLANDENVSYPELCKLIATDPAFSSEVLTIANSILYAPRYPSSSILHAITVLGAKALQCMCMTVGVRAYLGKTMNMKAMRTLWQHNLACAIIAEKLGSSGLIDKDIAYSSGILHDMGRMALAVVQPKPYAALLEKHQGSATSILEGERDLFGWDHCETGKKLVAEWKLPDIFEPVVSDHHSERRTDGAWSLLELIKVSCKLADAAGYPSFAGCELAPYETLLDELPARERRLFYPDADSLSAEIGERIRVVDSV
jgi:HD-like signal output (HDOD) protein